MKRKDQITIVDECGHRVPIASFMYDHYKETINTDRSLYNVIYNHVVYKGSSLEEILKAVNTYLEKRQARSMR